MSKVNTKGSGLNKIVSIDLCQNIDVYSTNNNSLPCYKNKDKKKQIELKSKIDIQMNYNCKETNKLKSNLVNKRLGTNTPLLSSRIPEEENILAIKPSLSQFKLKNKSNFSDSIRNLSSLETSEKEDDEENITFNSHSKVKMFSNFVDGSSTERKDEIHNKSLSKFYSEMSHKSHNNIREGSLEKTINNLNNKHTNKDNMFNIFNENNNIPDKIAYLNLLDNYKDLKLQFDEMRKNCEENEKVIKILNEILISQKQFIIEQMNKENLYINDLILNIESLKEENKYLIMNNNHLKSTLGFIYNKISEYENLREDKYRNQEKYLYQLLKENEYLRSFNNLIFGNIENQPKTPQRDNISESKKKKTELIIQTEQNSIELKENENDKLNLTKNIDELSKSTIEKDEINVVNQILKEYKNLKKGKTKLKPPQPLINSQISKEDNNSITLNSASNLVYRNLDTIQTNSKPRQQYLFFRTPKENEKKRFDFK